MSHSEARALRPAPSVVRPVVAAASMLLLLTVLGIVLFTMLRSPLKDDIAWLLYVARRWLAGRELYVDVVEVNPPLIVWISAIPIWLAGVLGIDAQYTAIPFFVAIVLGCAWWTANLLQGSGKLFEDRCRCSRRSAPCCWWCRPAIWASASICWSPPSCRTWRCSPVRSTAIGRRCAISLIAGVLAGLGCALKPRYAGVFVVLEGVALLRGMSPFRAKPLAAGVTMLAYAGLVALFCPAYLRRAVPLALALYGATDVPLLPSGGGQPRA